MSYTKGPWEVGYASTGNIETSALAVWQKEVLDSGFGSVICKVSPEKTMDDEDKANAQLIAAAPELLEALQLLLNTYIANVNTKGEFVICITPNGIPDYWIKAKAAIEKATGKKEELI